MDGFSIGMALNQMTDVEFLQCLLRLGMSKPEQNLMDNHSYHYRSRMQKVLNNLAKDNQGIRNGYGHTPEEQLAERQRMIDEAVAQGHTLEELGIADG